MSMNLHCEVPAINGRDWRVFDLWQTPTYITRMCLSLDENGDPDGGMEGVRRRYLIWLESLTIGRWDEHEIDDRYELKRNIEEHKEEILALENPQFYTV